jgi:hypothetical protein
MNSANKSHYAVETEDRVFLFESGTDAYQGTYSFNQFAEYAISVGEDFKELATAYRRQLFKIFNVIDVKWMSEHNALQLKNQQLAKRYNITQAV